MSSHSDEFGTTMCADNAEVADHRSERYRERMEGAGRRIKFAREEAGWSIRQLAEKCGVNHAQISRMETGDNLEISAGRFFDICDALALDPVYVWTGQTRTRRSMPGESTPPPPGPAAPEAHPKPPELRRRKR